jgi:hypothetical protein
LVNTLCESAFIGLPCPTKIAGIGTGAAIGVRGDIREVATARAAPKRHSSRECDDRSKDLLPLLR